MTPRLQAVVGAQDASFSILVTVIVWTNAFASKQDHLQPVSSITRMASRARESGDEQAGGWGGLEVLGRALGIAHGGLYAIVLLRDVFSMARDREFWGRWRENKRHGWATAGKLARGPMGMTSVAAAPSLHTTTHHMARSGNVRAF